MMHVSALLDALNLTVSFQPMANNPFSVSLHPNKQVDIFATGENGINHIGWLGELQPKVQRNYEIEVPAIYIFELNFNNIFQS